MQGFHLPHRQSSLKEGRTIHYKVPLQYQPEEDLTVGQILDKDAECFLCSTVSIMKSEKEIN